MTWSVKYPLSIIAGGDTKQGGFTKVKDEFTSIYGDLDTHIHDGNPDKGPKISAANITNTAAGNIAATDVQAAINELDTEKAALAGATFTGVVNEAKGANIASAATVNLTTATGNLVHITGTVTITAVTLGSGMRREVIFDGALTLTHHATNNNLPGGANITTAAGDRATYISDGTTVYCTKYQKANGTAILASVPIGTVIHVAQKTTPSGFLKANGAAVSRTTYAALFDALCPAQDFTVTIASPAVFSATGHSLIAGDPIRLTTDGALPTGLAAGTTYYVISAGLTADAFEVSTSVGGAAVNTSGSQSGTHTLRPFYFGVGDGSTTFNIPDLRGEFMRGYDDGRGVDSSRVLGSWQESTLIGEEGADNTFRFMSNADGTSGNYGDGFKTTGSGSYTYVWQRLRPRNIALLACIKY